MKGYFQEQMKNPEFAKAYHVVKLEKKLDEMLEYLKEKIDINAPKEVLLETINTTSNMITV
jgi:hypothetical protein